MLSQSTAWSGIIVTVLKRSLSKYKNRPLTWHQAGTHWRAGTQPRSPQPGLRCAYSRGKVQGLGVRPRFQTRWHRFLTGATSSTPCNHPELQFSHQWNGSHTKSMDSARIEWDCVVCISIELIMRSPTTINSAPVPPKSLSIIWSFCLFVFK